MTTTVFSRKGDEIGTYADDKIILNDGQHEWKIEEGNVYDSHDDFIGQLRDDAICRMVDRTMQDCFGCKQRIGLAPGSNRDSGTDSSG